MTTHPTIAPDLVSARQQHLVTEAAVHRARSTAGTPPGLLGGQVITLLHDRRLQAIGALLALLAGLLLGTGEAAAGRRVAY